MELIWERIDEPGVTEHIMTDKKEKHLYVLNHLDFKKVSNMFGAV